MNKKDICEFSEICHAHCTLKDIPQYCAIHRDVIFCIEQTKGNIDLCIEKEFGKQKAPFSRDFKLEKN